MTSTSSRISFEITSEGFRPFQEVRAEIEPRVRTEERKRIQMAKLEQALSSTGSDLGALAAALGTTVQSANAIRVSNPIVSGLGREPAFVGTIAGLDSGATSGAVAGNVAAFVVRRTDAGADPVLTDQQKTSIRTQLEQQRRTQLRSQWITGLLDKADIVDNRRVFAQ